MRSNNRIFVVILLMGTLLAGCGGNPAWNGPDDSDDKIVPIAEKACECIYETMDQDESISVGKVLDEVPDWKQVLKGEKVAEEVTPTILKIYSRDEPYSNTLDNTSCLKEVEDQLFEKGIDFEDFGEVLAQYCELALFYI